MTTHAPAQLPVRYYYVDDTKELIHWTGNGWLKETGNVDRALVTQVSTIAEAIVLETQALNPAPAPAPNTPPPPKPAPSGPPAVPPVALVPPPVPLGSPVQPVVPPVLPKPPLPLTKYTPKTLSTTAKASSKAKSDDSVKAAAVKFSGGTDTSSFVAQIMESVLKAPKIHPMVLSGLGQNNIMTYRIRFLKLVTEADLSPASTKTVVDFCMNMKNYKRLVGGIKNLDSEVKADPIVSAAINFIDSHCCDTTSEQLKMPTVKIPDSFPDICAVIFVTNLVIASAGKPRSNLDTDMKSMVSKTWAASLFLDDALQAVNKAAVKTEWDSWGKTGGNKKNRKGEVLAFNEEIYENQVNDKILLLNPDSTRFYSLDTGYTIENLVDWANGWFKAFQTTQALSIGM